MLPTTCPSCQSQLKVVALKCEVCSTEVTGLYELPVLLHLSEEELRFIIRFVKNSGSLKDMSAELKLSYPTVRNMLNEKKKKIQDHEEK